MTTTYLALYYLAGQLLTAFCQEVLVCDRLRAENCIEELQSRYDEVVARKNNIDIAKLDHLCVGVTRGNNVTECVLEASDRCDTTDPWPMGQKWENLHIDIRALCNKVCPKYSDRVRNASDCAKRIQYEDVARGHYRVFCQAFNITRNCVKRYQRGCQFSLMSYVLRDVPVFVKSAHALCFKDCVDIDGIMASARECVKTYDLNHIPARHDRYKRCDYFSNFVNCLNRTQSRDSCLNLRQLFEQVNGNFTRYMSEHRLYCQSHASTNNKDISSFRAMVTLLVTVISLVCR